MTKSRTEKGSLGLSPSILAMANLPLSLPLKGEGPLLERQKLTSVGFAQASKSPWEVGRAKQKTNDKNKTKKKTVNK